MFQAGQTLAETRVELRTGQVHHLLLSKLPEHIELGFHFFVLFLNVKYVNFKIPNFIRNLREIF